MRLLQRQADGTFSLTPPILDEKKTPPYAILSHTWGEAFDEVTYEDVLDQVGQKKEGYDKLRFCADQAVKDNLRYFWIDTCCIKKSSETELTEAINSMYRWYRDSTKCYVYMRDVPSTTFKQSRWFTRGWTLQELLAPPVVEFFDTNACYLGSKDSLKEQIHQITEIPVAALIGVPLSEFPRETILCWGSRRMTTRKEDAAYCMLGLFGIHMPLIYGEGENAMARLKNKILRKVIQPNDVTKYTVALFDSLKFKHIEDRCNNIRSPHTDTCSWIFNNESYKSWLDDSQILRHYGLLWLKGKPGTGKSTLMKHILLQNRLQRRESIHVSFFFNARGTLLERDTRGLYRSLLYQLLTYVGRAKEFFEDYKVFELPEAPDFAWTIPQLQRLFVDALRKLEDHRLWIYVDALDECGQDQVRDLVGFFHTIGANTKVRILFASRYYPKIFTPNKIELRLDNEEDHLADIVCFVNSELKGGSHVDHEALQKARDEVIERASGIFIWVYLVVRILNKAYDHGQILALQRRLEEIPDDLNDLFDDVLARDSENFKDMRLCIRWILFSRRPLERQELYFAVNSGIHPEELGDLDVATINPDTMDAFILSSSHGLAELTTSRPPVVQFIHETIREFFLKGGGTQHIRDNPDEYFPGSAHDTLLQCCLSYLALAKPHFHLPLSPNMESPQSPLRIGHRAIPSEDLCTRLPFIVYSLSFALYHADLAETGGKPQDHLLRSFIFTDWLHMVKCIRRLKTDEWNREFKLGELYRIFKLNEWHSQYLQDYPLHSNPPYILARQNYSSLLAAWKRVDPHATIDIGAPLSPIRVALERKHYDSIRVLLGSRWAPAAINYRPLHSELTCLIETYQWVPEEARSNTNISHFWFNWCSERELLVLLSCGTFPYESDISPDTQHNPLAFAASRGYIGVVEYLLNIPGVDCNRQDHMGLTPLMRAAKEGRTQIISLLLLQQHSSVAVNIQCGRGRTALSYAAENGNQSSCRILLDHPHIQMNTRDLDERTPFFYASMRGRMQIVRLFMESKTLDVVSRDRMKHTALAYAAMNGHTEVVEALLSHENTEVNSQDDLHGRTPLIFALEYEHLAVARLLLERSDIQVDMMTKRKKSALVYAREAMRKALDGGARAEVSSILEIIENKISYGDAEADSSCDSDTKDTYDISNCELSSEEEWAIE